MQSVLAKCAAVLVGGLLLLFAVAMLMEGSGFVQSGRNNALAYVIGLLGLGLIAAAFFGESLKYHGGEKGPLGKIIATGGAAVFVIGLIFILSSGDDPGRGGETQQPPSASSTGGAGGAPEATAQSSPAAEETQVAAAGEEASEGQEPAAVTPTLNQPDPAALGQGNHFAWTYCSTCCPQGPENCPHTAWGAGTSAEQAAATAILYCTGSGGFEQSCRGNVQFVSQDELPL